MFFWLRRLVILLFVTTLTLIGIYLYREFRFIDPIVDFAEAGRNRFNNPVTATEELNGKVVRVLGPDYLQLRQDGIDYYVRLIGVHDPAETPKELASATRKELNQLVLSNQVSARLTTVTEQRTALGIVRVGKTHMNASLLEEGSGKLNRKTLKGLPLNDQYLMIRAERKAREARRGIWSEEIQALQKPDTQSHLTLSGK